MPSRMRPERDGPAPPRQTPLPCARPEPSSARRPHASSSFHTEWARVPAVTRRSPSRLGALPVTIATSRAAPARQAEAQGRQQGRPGTALTPLHGPAWRGRGAGWRLGGGLVRPTRRGHCRRRLRPETRDGSTHERRTRPEAWCRRWCPGRSRPCEYAPCAGRGRAGAWHERGGVTYPPSADQRPPRLLQSISRGRVPGVSAIQMASLSRMT